MRELSSAAQKRGFACGIIRIKGGREKDQGDLGITVHEIAFVLPKAISVRVKKQLWYKGFAEREGCSAFSRDKEPRTVCGFKRGFADEHKRIGSKISHLTPALPV